MDGELKVYLDHLIPRQSLRYERSEERIESKDDELPIKLRLSDLTGDHVSSRIKYLRKPDFQRATWAWDADQCVELLDSVINQQIIPSIIMWTSPESELDYVLDGGHRISVVLAWLKDDWGQKVEFEHDEILENRVKQAAQQVRKLVRERIGTIEEYKQAEEEFDKAVNDGKAPKLALPKKIFERAQFYTRYRKGIIGFPILWVPGDFEKAEKSFLKINKTGTKLTEWETKLIENRNSSLARTIMSVANIESAKYYWPTTLPEALDQKSYTIKVTEILANVANIYRVLLEPPYLSPAKGRRLQQPLLDIASKELKPPYLAELFTVIKGGKGQATETDELIKLDTIGTAENIIDAGWDLTREVTSALSHLIGDSPKSLAVVPACYFYTDGGRYVRSLLYGLIYWLLSGNDEDVIRLRKQLFSAYRGTFEQILLDRKEDVVSGITRKTGSGPEITVQTARYFQGLLETLVKHKGVTNSPGFNEDYNRFTATLIDSRTKAIQQPAGKSRTFSEKQRSIATLRDILKGTHRCEICEGLLDITGGVQHDHTIKYSEGGPSIASNARLTHPFCNNMRDAIEEIKLSKSTYKVPALLDEIFISTHQKERQLNFFTDLTGFDLYSDI